MIIYIILYLGSFLTCAYLDPGSGSIIIQLLLAALMGLGFVLRSQWKKIKSFFTRKKNISNNEKDVDKQY